MKFKLKNSRLLGFFFQIKICLPKTDREKETKNII